MRAEDEIQKAVVNHLKSRPAPGLVWCAVQNEGKRSYKRAAWAKAMGLTPGMPDILLWRAGESFALELKSTKGRLSLAQAEVLNGLSAAGCNADVAYGLNCALLILEQWGCLIGKGIPTECQLSGCLGT